MNNRKTQQNQLTIFDILDQSSLTEEIERITSCPDSRVLNACAKSIEYFEKIPSDQRYVLSFSGGKDSHILLAIYLLYLKLGNSPLDLVVRFADTELEHESLYQTIEQVQNHCQENEIAFEIVKGKHSYWSYQFKDGYPVPNYRARWCTGKLKTNPLQPSKKIKALTGRHFGESRKRDQKLAAACGGESCGTDLIKKDRYDPIAEWSNCLVWDGIFFLEKTLLYENCFDLLQAQYKMAKETKSGSLRLGCFMCPVIALKTLKQNLDDGIINQDDYQIRLALEELRSSRRINSPRTKKAGAIYVEDRRIIWEKINKDYLLQRKAISQKDVEFITESLKSNYCYPMTYSKEWIDREHELLAKNQEG